MNIVVLKDPGVLGKAAATQVAGLLKEAIAKKGISRLLLSTGASQLTTLEALVKMDVAWDRVEMFHLDEYVDLPETHMASFRKYLRERFVDVVHPRASHFVDGNPENIPVLTQSLRAAPIDVGLIGIGENSHIAFNDPPADFNTREAYILVTLSETCKRQQVREGWFSSMDEVPRQAISMTVHQIMQCRHIISCVPFAVKANAVKHTLESEVTNTIPATILKSHPSFTLYVDDDSYSTVDESQISPVENFSFCVRHGED